MVIVPKEFELVEYLRLQERGRDVVGDSCCVGGDKKKHEIPIERFLHPNHTLKQKYYTITNYYYSPPRSLNPH